MKCSATTEDGKCKAPAIFVVEKNDLSHREALYCDFHAKPYRLYPADFSVTKSK
jgi:hypothetical protein